MKEENIKVKEQRNSNIELLRIIAMIMIIVFHMVEWLEIFIRGSYQNKILGTVLDSFGKISVNIFVLISGYFLINKKISFKKVLKLWLEVMFYSIIMFAICNLLKLRSIFPINYVRTFLPISYENYWFVSAYFMLYIIIPVLNEIAIKLDKKTYKKLLVIVALFFSLGYTIFYRANNYMVPIEGASGFFWFVYLYLLAGYIKIYGIEMLEKKKDVIISTIVISIAYIVLLVIINFRLGHEAMQYYRDMNSIIPLILSVFIFYIFKNLNIKQNKIINYLGSITFAMYLTHENILTKLNFWAFIRKISKVTNLDYINTIIATGITLIMVITATSIFELIRKPIEKIIFKSKILNRLIEKIDNKILN